MCVWDVSCKARFAGLRPWFAPVRRGVGGGVGGLYIGLVRSAFGIFALRSTPNELLPYDCRYDVKPGPCCGVVPSGGSAAQFITV
jgi:hypothetical protein